MALLSNIVVYINGVRFYPSNITATFEVGDVGRFTLDVPPVPHWDQLPVRSHAAVFYADNVTGSYRLLCEGDYVGKSRSKTGTGQRSRTLSFRGLPGLWNNVHYTNIAGTSGPDSSLTQAALGAIVNGQVLNYNTTTSSITNVKSLREILDSQQGGKRVFAMFHDLITAVINQTPVDSYYYHARRVPDKMVVLEDNALSAALTFDMFKDINFNGPNANGYPSDTPLGTIISDFEGIAFYRHTPIPSPPLWSGSTLLSDTQDLPPAQDIESAQIAELMFIPELYDTVPPACNVIFDDQVRSLTSAQDFTATPTRVAAQLQVPEGDKAGIPKYYLANDEMTVVHVAEQAEIPPALRLTHATLSSMELERGVIQPGVISVGFERLIAKATGVNADQTSANPSLDDYLNNACLNLFSKTRGAYLTADLQCVFLPMLMPGFACVVEDGNTPFRAMVRSVTHSIPSTGEPVTSVSLSHVNELYSITGVNRTSPLPVYLNEAFRPEKIADTYNNVFGKNFYTTPRACAVDKGSLKPSTSTATVPVTENYTVAQIDMDVALGTVVPVPSYAQSSTTENRSTGTLAASAKSASVASLLRSSSTDPASEFRKFQWRPGVSIRQWAAFHSLTAPNDADTNPPAQLTSPSWASLPEVFAIPESLVMNGLPTSSNPASGDTFGIFTAGTRSNDRVTIALAIQAAIDGRVTFDGRQDT